MRLAHLLRQTREQSRAVHRGPALFVYERRRAHRSNPTRRAELCYSPLPLGSNGPGSMQPKVAPGLQLLVLWLYPLAKTRGSYHCYSPLSTCIECATQCILCTEQQSSPSTRGRCKALRKQLERDDDRFIYQVENPGQYQTALGSMTRFRLYCIAMMILVSLISLGYLLLRKTGPALTDSILLFAVLYLYLDIRMKVMKTAASLQQERHDNDSPEAS